MALDLLHGSLTGQMKADTSEMNTSSASDSTTSKLSEAQVRQILRQINQLVPGQTLQGQLVEKDGSQLKLMLSESVLLNTSLDQDLELQTGQTITFEVKGKHNGQLTISPLFLNTKQGENAVKALQQAFIPVSDSAVSTVEKMMNEGLPIQKEALAKFFYELSMHSESDMNDLISLHKMNIPVTDESIMQMHSFQNLEDTQLIQTNDMTNQIEELLSVILKNEGPQKTEQLFMKILSAFSTDTQKGILSTMNEESVTGQTTAESNLFTEGDSALQTTNIDRAKQSLTQLQDAFSQLLKGGGEQENTGKIFHERLLNFIDNNLLWNQEDFQQKDIATHYYKKVSDTLNQLEDVLNEAKEGSVPLLKTVSQAKSNINFVNQVNELYQYIQMPLKLNGKQSNTSLYVYQRAKKNKQDQSDEPLTAYLHLSMEHLGKLDIYLSLKGQEQLTTKFCVEKEEIIDFLEEHIDQLDKHLKDKGFKTTIQITQSESNTETLETLLDSKNEVKFIAKQSFDARA